MSSTGNQTYNGKAFEYALLVQYVEGLTNRGQDVVIVEDQTYKTNKIIFEKIQPGERLKFEEAAQATIDTLVKLEPGLTSPKDKDDRLIISMVSDAEGQKGDVRDIIIRREIIRREKSKWEIGFSAKNNHDAVKHSRLAEKLDFGESWFGIPCTKAYWEEVRPIFEKLHLLKKKGSDWKDVDDKTSTIYIPILEAFKKELLRICKQNKQIPEKLIKYLIGRYPFYKIIKEDKYNLVCIRAFNTDNGLNKKLNGVAPKYTTPKINYPTRVVELDYKRDSETTLILILDEGWEISFRIHNASTKVEPSLKFDIQLIGNPPIIFTQHLFQ